jgi:hypothetical protein
MGAMRFRRPEPEQFPSPWPPVGTRGRQELLALSSRRGLAQILLCGRQPPMLSPQGRAERRSPGSLLVWPLPGLNSAVPARTFPPLGSAIFVPRWPPKKIQPGCRAAARRRQLPPKRNRPHRRPSLRLFGNCRERLSQSRSPPQLPVRAGILCMRRNADLQRPPLLKLCRWAIQYTSDAAEYMTDHRHSNFNRRRRHVIT